MARRFVGLENAFKLPEAEAFFGLYTPGYGDSDDPSVAKRNGGMLLTARMDIPYIADGVELEFELDPFSILQSTDLATFLIPNFRAYAAIDNATTGLEPSSKIFNVSNVEFKLEKDEQGLRGYLTGDAYLLGASFMVDGHLSFDSSGLFAVLEMKLEDGNFLPDLGIEFDGNFLFELNASAEDQEFRYVNLLGVASFTEVLLTHYGIVVSDDDIDALRAPDSTTSFTDLLDTLEVNLEMDDAFLIEGLDRFVDALRDPDLDVNRHSGVVDTLRGLLRMRVPLLEWILQTKVSTRS